MELFSGVSSRQRDFDFATKYNLDIIIVYLLEKLDKNKLKHTGNGKIINSDFLNDLEVSAAKEK